MNSRMIPFLLAALVALVSIGGGLTLAGCPHQTPEGTPAIEETDAVEVDETKSEVVRLGVGMGLYASGEILRGAAEADAGKLGAVGCIVSDALGDVLSPVGLAVVGGAKASPALSIDYCGCLDLYGPPPLDGLGEALTGRIESSLAAASVFASMGSEVSGDCTGGAWAKAVLSAAQSLPSQIDDAVRHASCRVEIPAVSPDLSACLE